MTRARGHVACDARAFGGRSAGDGRAMGGGMGGGWEAVRGLLQKSLVPRVQGFSAEQLTAEDCDAVRRIASCREKNRVLVLVQFDANFQDVLLVYGSNISGENKFMSVDVLIKRFGAGRTKWYEWG